MFRFFPTTKNTAFKTGARAVDFVGNNQKRGGINYNHVINISKINFKIYRYKFDSLKCCGHRLVSMMFLTITTLHIYLK